MLYPDAYTLLHVTGVEEDYGFSPVIRVFATFRGGFSQGDSWKLSSGTVKATPDDVGHYDFEQVSGTIYKLTSIEGRHTMWTTEVLDSILKSYEEANIPVKMISLVEALKLMNNYTERSEND